MKGIDVDRHARECMIYFRRSWLLISRRLIVAKVGDEKLIDITLGGDINAGDIVLAAGVGTSNFALHIDIRLGRLFGISVKADNLDFVENKEYRVYGIRKTRDTRLLFYLGDVLDREDIAINGLKFMDMGC